MQRDHFSTKLGVCSLSSKWGSRLIAVPSSSSAVNPMGSQTFEASRVRLGTSSRSTGEARTKYKTAQHLVVDEVKTPFFPQSLVLHYTILTMLFKILISALSAGVLAAGSSSGSPVTSASASVSYASGSSAASQTAPTARECSLMSWLALVAHQVLQTRRSSLSPVVRTSANHIHPAPDLPADGCVCSVADHGQLPRGRPACLVRHRGEPGQGGFR